MLITLVSLGDGKRDRLIVRNIAIDAQCRDLEDVSARCRTALAESAGTPGYQQSAREEKRQRRGQDPAMPPSETPESERENSAAGRKIPAIIMPRAPRFSFMADAPPLNGLLVSIVS